MMNSLNTAQRPPGRDRPEPWPPAHISGDLRWLCERQRPFSLVIAGEDDGPMPSHGLLFTRLPLGMTLESTEETSRGFVVRYRLASPAVAVTCRFDSADGEAVTQTNAIVNESDRPLTLTHFSSGLAVSDFFVRGNDFDGLVLHRFDQCWEAEGQHRAQTLREAGLFRVSGHRIANTVRLSSIGSWSTSRHLPLVFLEEPATGRVLFLQQESSANWQIQIGALSCEREANACICLEAGSLSHANGAHARTLEPGERYEAFACTYGQVTGGMEAAVRALTRHRRAVRPARPGQQGPVGSPVVFNDYMNSLWANPTTARLLPLIDRAAEVGAEVYCIDAGWFCAPGQSWGSVLGDWEISDSRFDGMGLEGIIRYIRGKSMKAGIWFELECATVDAAVAGRPDDWFLMRHGRRIIANGRLFFNLDNEAVREYLFAAVDRLARLGIRFIKNDYNESLGAGCDNNGAASLADGLDRAVRATYRFYRDLRDRHPELIIENCASGAMREDHGILAYFDMQSTSDQEDYRRYPSIIIGSSAALLPEQAGIWAYPYPLAYRHLDNEAILDSPAYRAAQADGEQTVFNMVSGLCGVPYISGRIDKADARSLSLIREAVTLYKAERAFIAGGYAATPLGYKDFNDTHGFAAYGIVSEERDRMLLAVWRLGGEAGRIRIPAALSGPPAQIRQLYPGDSSMQVPAHTDGRMLTIELDKPYSARFFEIRA